MSVTQTPGGTLYYLWRSGFPSLVAVYKPSCVSFAAGSQPAYHLFYHPYITDLYHSQWTHTDYPTGSNYRNLLYRYMFAHPEQANLGQKSLIYQHEPLTGAPGKQVVLVFPVAVKEHDLDGTRIRNFHDLRSEEGALERLLQEVHFLLQRMEGVLFPSPRLPAVILSCFSGALEFVYRSIRLARRSGGDFYERALREVYLFDPVAQSRSGESAQSATDRKMNEVMRWWSQGAQNRRLRVYTRRAYFDGSLGEALEDLGAEWIREHSGREIHHTSGSLVKLPLAFWRQLWPDLSSGSLDGASHQAFPVLFAAHAIEQSGF